MSLQALSILIIGTLILALMTALPVAFCLFGLAALYMLIFVGPNQLVVLFLNTVTVTTTDVFIAVPLFIVMAGILETSGIASNMYEMMYKWFGGLRGGLAIGTIFICTIIAAMTGIGATGVVMMGVLAYPEMMKRGYDKYLAIGCIPVGGALGPLIPPSVIMIIIAGFGQLSVGKMFIGGIIPGLLMSFLFCLYIAIRAWLQPQSAPAIPRDERYGWKEKFVSLKGVILPVILILLVLGSIYSGAATPTEAAGVGALGAVVCAAINRQLKWKNLKEALVGTMKVTSMVMWLLIGGSSFATLLGMTGVRGLLSENMVNLPVEPIVVILIMQLIGLFMGCFIDASSIIIITIPIFMPIVVRLGFDPLWFAILYTINMVIGYITPPFGANLFFTKGILPENVTMGDIYKAVQWYLIPMFAVLAIGFFWPPLLTWLPGLMSK